MKNVLVHTGQQVLEPPPTVQGYIRTKHHTIIKNVIASHIFSPIYIFGLSGVGKTLTVHQVCAELNRPIARVNITTETDEDDLLGGFRLINGETKWFDGPVTLALKQGSVLLLDEVDLATNKIMCLQSILEGSGVYLKKIGEYVQPTKGFNIIATANTRGVGDDTGRFQGTNLLNEAFLDRFPIWLEQEYPTHKQEQKILLAALEEMGVSPSIQEHRIIDNLIKWATQIRKSFFTGVQDNVISTRRLVQIVQMYVYTGKNLPVALRSTLNRFEASTRDSFLDIFHQYNGKPEEGSLTEDEEIPLDTVEEV